MPKRTEEKSRYLESFIGPKNPISVSRMAKALGIKRNTLYVRVKKPFRNWDLGDLEKIAELLNWDLIEMIKIALVYEPKEDVTPSVSASEPKDTSRKHNPEQTTIEQQSAIPTD